MLLQPAALQAIYMQKHIRESPARFCLKSQPHPAVAGRRKAAAVPAGGGGGGGESEKPPVFIFFQTAFKEAVFMLQHPFQTGNGDIALGAPIDQIAESHIISGYAFGHCLRSLARLEKIIDGLLAGAYFRKGAVNVPCLIEDESFADDRL